MRGTSTVQDTAHARAKERCPRRESWGHRFNTANAGNLLHHALGHDPDVSEADVMVMPLELDGTGGVFLFHSAAGRVGDVGVVLDELAVPVDGGVGVLDLLAVL